jgi:hypothetical protein
MEFDEDLMCIMRSIIQPFMLRYNHQIGRNAVKPRGDSPGMPFPSPYSRRNVTLHVFQMQHAHAQAIGIQIPTCDDVSDTSPRPGRKSHWKLRVTVMCMSVLFHAPESVEVFEPPYQSRLTRGKGVFIDLV